MPAPRILALDPGTRAMGYALLEGDQLVYQGVKVFPRDVAPHEQLAQYLEGVASLIVNARPRVLAVERTLVAKSARMALLNTFALEIERLGRKRRLKVLSFAPNTVKKFVTGSGTASKEKVAEMLIYRYPELRAYLIHESCWKRRHHENMFDALAVGLLARHALTGR